MADGKGFGGGKATRDPNPTVYDPNDPKAKQTAIHKAETYADYLARRGSGNAHGAQTGQSVVNNKSGVVSNTESYAVYMAKRKAQYRAKFGTASNKESFSYKILTGVKLSRYVP